jgi:hypothetical protein
MTQIRKSPSSHAASTALEKQIERRERIDASKVKCDEWNKLHPVGINIKWRGETTHTVCRAMVSLSGDASVFIACRMGAVALDSVEVVK